MAASARTTTAPQHVLLSFLTKATKAMQSCRVDVPLDLSECRSLLLDLQRSCLDQVVNEHNEKQSREDYLTREQVQEALGNLSSQRPGGGGEPNSLLGDAVSTMNATARLAFARLVLQSECLRTSTHSLNLNNIESNSSGEAKTERKEPLKTSRMTRSEILEFCGLCRAAVRLESVHAHLKDAQQPLFQYDLAAPVKDGNSSNKQTPTPASIPPIKRVENLQRLLLQAIGYDADMGMAELARQVQMEGNDDVELVQTIRETTSTMMETLLKKVVNSTEELLSDHDQGGVTRIVSVQHSETILQVDQGEDGHSNTVRALGKAPVPQSMHSDNERNPLRESAPSLQLQMAKEAAALRESLAQELNSLDPQERRALLQRAEQALHDFQQRAMQLPAGAERIQFMRSMDKETQKLLAMHRIWMEQQLEEN
jgi:hypothetical protein